MNEVTEGDRLGDAVQLHGVAVVLDRLVGGVWGTVLGSGRSLGSQK